MLIHENAIASAFLRGEAEANSERTYNKNYSFHLEGFPAASCGVLQLARCPSGSIFDELNLFNNEAASFFGGGGLDEPKGRPAVNLYERADDYVVTAELPGVDPEKIDITQEGGMLTLRGGGAEEPEDKGARYYRRERVMGSFERSIKFPFAVNPEDVEARFNNGLLTVTVKKPEEQKPKKIEIKNN